MGSAFTPGGESRGVIPAVMDAIFARVAAESGGVGFTVRVGFVEIHKVGEGQGPPACGPQLGVLAVCARGVPAGAQRGMLEVLLLLLFQVCKTDVRAARLRISRSLLPLPCLAIYLPPACLLPLQEEIHDLLCTGRGPHPAVHIREAGGSVCLAGAAEREVHSRQEMVEVLEHGTLLRATGGPPRAPRVACALPCMTALPALCKQVWLAVWWLGLRSTCPLAFPPPPTPHPPAACPLSWPLPLPRPCSRHRHEQAVQPVPCHLHHHAGAAPPGAGAGAGQRQRG